MSLESATTLLKNRLLAVQQFTVLAQSDRDSSISGQGRVSVENNHHNNVIWRESGCWDASMSNLEFSNVYRWSWSDGYQLSLEHMRYGDQNPVHLVSLEKNKTNLWNSVQPYLCGQDSYKLELTVLPDMIVMKWQIEGSKKNQISTVCYV